MSDNLEVEVGSGNVFADLCLPNADDLLVRSRLLIYINELIKNSCLTQTEVAKKLGITQTKVSLLVSGRITEFSTATLINYLALIGCNVDIHVRKPSSHSAIFHRRGSICVK